MTLRTRIAILVACFCVFLAAAPAVVLYTAGYRWNLKKQRIEKVGLLFLRSRPDGASIWLDGVKRKERTPTRLRNLLPGTYTITVGRDGFIPWTKQLAVESERTTFAEGIVLIRDAVSETVDDESALSPEERILLNRATPLLAPIDKEMLASDGYELWIENEDGEREVITRLGEEIVSVLPYPDESYLFYQTRSAVHVIERDGRDRRNDVVLAETDGMAGMATDPRGTTLYYQTKKDGVTVLWQRPLQ